jgi:hypothetical protein
MKIMTAAQFIRENTKHLKGVTDEALITSETKRAYIKLVRSDVRLPRSMREIFAVLLEADFFPTSPRQERAGARQRKAEFIRSLISLIAAEKKAKDIPRPTEEALNDVATIYKVSVETMKKRIQRAKIAPLKKGQKL